MAVKKLGKATPQSVTSAATEEVTLQPVNNAPKTLPEHVSLTAEESLHRMQEFSQKRKEALIAAVRKDPH